MEIELSDLKRNIVAHSQLRQIFSNGMIGWNLKSSAKKQLGIFASTHSAKQGYQEVLSDINAMVFIKNIEVTEFKSAMMRLRNQRKSMFEDGIGSKYRNQEQVTMTRSGVINIGKALKTNGYLNVQVIQYARVPLVKCRDPIYNLDIDLTVNKEIPIHNSSLIRDYLMSDSSGKVKSAALVLKKIMKEEGICDASAGFLSSYSWIVLLLHFLQRHEFLPPFQTERDKNSFNNRSVFCEDIYVGYSLPKTLPWFYQQRLANVGVAELLIMFTEYMVRCVNIRTDCLTMRGAGETLTKECWREGNQVGRTTPWRLSIEVIQQL